DPRGRAKSGALLVDGQRLQSHLDAGMDHVVVKSARPRGQFARQTREPKAGRNAVGADRIPHRQAFDERGGLWDFEHHVVDVVLWARVSAGASFGVMAKDVQNVSKVIKISLPGNTADGGDDAGERARGIGAA